MRTLIDLRLLDEVAGFSLKYTCEDCAHFDDTRRRCSLGYPNDEHRHSPLVLGESTTFCKEFDLG